MHRRILAVAGVLALSLPTTAAFAATADDPTARFDRSQSTDELQSSIDAAALDPDRQVGVVIEMEGDPVAVVQAEEGRTLSKSERTTVKKDLKKAQDAIRGKITAEGGKIRAQMQSAYNGIQATVPAARLDDLSALPGVVAVHPVVVHELDNSVSVPFLGVPAVWEDTGYTGENVKVAILDTGIDYTHAGFGGPGTVEAYEAAAAASDQAADPALFGPNAPRIKGGIDLVGDDYDAGGEGDALVPKPDPNPLDCEGHGSHVAGTTGGSGVLPDGSTFDGPYDSSTPSVDFRVGPGVAPEADLYAVRLFGCDGSTDATIQAIDWAVDNGMDVINMSLGSSYGTGDDPSAVAASNAVGAGVVVVASAGNSGPSPYLTGSPGSGDGVVAVSAVDSAESFPGATITVGGKTVQAINANGASVDGLGELTVVRLTDDPATTVNEALGCAVSDYTRAGVVAGGNQLAVVDRGTCARAAKPIFGQQAGAAAVVMVNSTNDLPPYEGPIFENPDDGTPFEVTIPFLGVRLSDGPAFTTGATATLVGAEIANPGFRGYASFSSSGPRSGDSAISPDLAAPGVSISSVAVGTGSEPSIKSGTSMAAPHVAGVAALSVQAHPEWDAEQVAAALVSTADPDKVAGLDPTRGGLGLVDTAQAVGTSVTATGDAFETESGRLRESALSFGFQESTKSLGGKKKVTVRNDGSKSVTFTVTTQASEQSLDAKVSVSSKKVTVRPGRTATFSVSVSAAASTVPSSLAGADQFAFSEISGNVVLTSADATLRVPYLLVPRSNSDVTAKGSLSSRGKVTDGDRTLELRNRKGAIDAAADVYTWGLSDKKDAPKSISDTGYDLRAAGVQSFTTTAGDRLAVFAVNTHQRWSNAASNEFDVVIDTNRDGTPDWVVFSYDSGAVRTGSVDGITEVFLQNAKTGALIPSGFLAQAPTDSSTLLLPVDLADIGVTGAFDYTVQSFSLTTDGSDAFAGSATYDPADPAISNGQYELVPRGGSADVTVRTDASAFAAQKPLGAMVVVVDNESGADEALLVKVK
ncbi:S8 family serine peptidase [Microbacterium sp. EYE_5]|uniref:S8 family peptidase n=1 Tax=unclassified Microbacterium TaxID=2609290 RepID=UPI00200571E3|nr:MULTISPECIES: S8 family serine peptidase [unclassified Microbacterium]MCK6081712.1 S8 family serine peptidase [Microbacterium sp. EYE_382]MCK6086982.1 S8 family serine peptidase [Microbacterium sp. EYE_384]MCK6123520.1 S8 family serine peptidase [Microbacterium sp. EYE_80]MCK6126429.1 S8 family serine peptidase [Microbacterium sp. EYE_79]MCK6142666.1 S8 family serine peptidase [Microbacterium sp. EYE_39]